MIKGKVRSLLAGAAGVASMLLALTAANALETRLGDIQIFVDSTVSVGTSVRTAERMNEFLPAGNGGPKDIGLGPGANITDDRRGASQESLLLGLYQADVTVTNNPGNYDGSINTDDGRLNYDQWDLISGNIKATHDLQANWQNYTLFTRASYFYDAVLNDMDPERSDHTSRVTHQIGRDFELLDAYVSADYNVADLPLNVRLGKQVISWGEGTFLLNGINVVNPIDVTAFRRPGAEIKEGLIPVWAAYASLGLPWDLTLEAFYQLKWDRFKVDPAGSPFSGNDVFNQGYGQGGNVGGNSLIGGGPLSGTFRRNCSGSALLTAGNLLTAGWASDPTADCAADPQIDYNAAIPEGQVEAARVARGDANVVRRDSDLDPSDSGQYGVALRWYSEELNSTEFGFYFMNYHSRLPYASLRATTPYISGFAVTPDDASALTRHVPVAGCGASYLSTGSFLDPRMSDSSLLVADPMGLAAANAALADSILGLAANPDAGNISPSVAATTPGFVTIGDLSKINCAFAAVQATNTGLIVDPGEGLGAGIPGLVNGAELLAISSRSTVFFEYPEDINMWGMSFNTTIGDWGVQGEVSYRPNMPLQLDSDALTIGGAAAQCAFLPAAFDLSGALEGLVTSGESCNPALGIGGRDVTGYRREEVITAQIGTTATYSNSNPVVGFLGADIGILVTELGMVWVDDVSAKGGIPLANTGCQGSDLALGSLVGLDSRDKCRPTSTAWGVVLLGRADYNNAFNTPWTISPSVSFSWDISGTAPAPIGNYLDDSKSINVGVSASLQNTWRASISYTNNFGGGIYNKSRDRDFASVSLSYSF